MFTGLASGRKGGLAMGPIAKLTFQEVLHKRIFYIVLAMTAAFLALYSLGLGFAYKEFGLQQGFDADQLLHQGMITAQLFGAGLYFSTLILALLAILASVSSINLEVESGIMYGMLAKPITRREVVLGKFIGYALLLSFYGLLLFLAVYGINYALAPLPVLAMDWSYFLIAALLYILQALILVSLGLFLSTRFDAINAGVIAIILYGSGLVGGFLEQIGNAINNTALVNTGIVTSLVMPVDAIYRKMYSIFLVHNNLPIALAGTGVPGGTAMPSTAMVYYGIIYACFFVFLAVRTFNARDL